MEQKETTKQERVNIEINVGKPEIKINCPKCGNDDIFGFRDAGGGKLLGICIKCKDKDGEDSGYEFILPDEIQAKTRRWMDNRATTKIYCKRCGKDKQQINENLCDDCLAGKVPTWNHY